MDMNEADFEKQRLRLAQNSGTPTAPDEDKLTTLETKLPSNPNPYLNLQQEVKALSTAYTTTPPLLSSAATLPRRSDIVEYTPEAEMYPRCEEPNEKAQQFRLHKINEIQKILDIEKQKRASLAKKYQRGINVVTGVSYALEVAVIGLGAAGTTLLSTVIAAPVVIQMEGAALAAGGLSIAGNLVCDKVLAAKTKKHSQIKMLAEAKVNTISDHVSKALQDNIISDEEFTLIMSELEKYYSLREEVKNKSRAEIDDNTKRSLIKQGKEQAVEEFKNMFGANIPLPPR